MIKRTEKEILDFADVLWDESHDVEFKVTVYEDRTDLKVSAMYEAPGLTFATLMKLSEFFGTKNINDDDRFSRGGCETCDYGSCYGFTLTIRPD